MHEHIISMTKKLQDVLEKWLRAVNHGDVENLLGLYDREAILIPAFSDWVHNNPEELCEYFEKLGTRERLSVLLQEKTFMIQNLHNKITILSGIYNWHFSANGEVFNIGPRFSYVMDLSKSAPILHHHSSQTPRTL